MPHSQCTRIQTPVSACPVPPLRRLHLSIDMLESLTGARPHAVSVLRLALLLQPSSQRGSITQQEPARAATGDPNTGPWHSLHPVQGAIATPPVLDVCTLLVVPPGAGRELEALWWRMLSDAGAGALPRPQSPPASGATDPHPSLHTQQTQQQQQQQLEAEVWCAHFSALVSDLALVLGRRASAGEQAPDRPGPGQQQARPEGGRTHSPQGDAHASPQLCSPDEVVHQTAWCSCQPRACVRATTWCWRNCSQAAVVRG